MGCFQAQGYWTIKGNIKQEEGDKRSISEFKYFRAAVHKYRNTTTGKIPRREKIFSVLFCFYGCNILQKRKKKIQRDLLKQSLPFTEDYIKLECQPRNLGTEKV